MKKVLTKVWLPNADDLQEIVNGIHQASGNAPITIQPHKNLVELVVEVDENKAAMVRGFLMNMMRRKSLEGIPTVKPKGIFDLQKEMVCGTPLMNKYQKVKKAIYYLRGAHPNDYDYNDSNIPWVTICIMRGPDGKYSRGISICSYLEGTPEKKEGRGYAIDRAEKAMNLHQNFDYIYGASDPMHVFMSCNDRLSYQDLETILGNKLTEKKFPLAQYNVELTERERYIMDHIQ